LAEYSHGSGLLLRDSARKSGGGCQDVPDGLRPTKKKAPSQEGAP